ncbi:uncharacterized protein LY89DRAFT_664326 [Mollisia scopiformis]|uniref:Uncharacterized protein n=1 Tax=Mollisia scopiformis TaxID=149040 RepID=A0A194XQR3_MOLSC|nr:uncharacterized protein LY89DRAFT_664326 [Mollisia scopiformis]KUJ22511.1 hypothetical protein LY89DRAFT_664326 [Mollisia scopiformis]
MSAPPSYSEPPPRYSQVVDPNPARYAVNNRQAFQVAPLPSRQQHPVVQALPFHQAYNPQPYMQPYMQPYPNVQYQQPYVPYVPHNYFYPPFGSTVQPYPTPTPFYQPQSTMYQASPQIASTEAHEYQQQSYVPPPPSGYVAIPGTNFAVPEEWIAGNSKKSKKSRKKNKCAKALLRVLYG